MALGEAEFVVETILRILFQECLQFGGVVSHHPCCSRLKGTAEILLGVHHPQVCLVEEQTISWHSWTPIWSHNLHKNVTHHMPNIQGCVILVVVLVQLSGMLYDNALKFIEFP